MITLYHDDGRQTRQVGEYVDSHELVVRTGNFPAPGPHLLRIDNGPLQRIDLADVIEFEKRCCDACREALAEQVR